MGSIGRLPPLQVIACSKGMICGMSGNHWGVAVLVRKDFRCGLSPPLITPGIRGSTYQPTNDKFAKGMPLYRKGLSGIRGLKEQKIRVLAHVSWDKNLLEGVL